MRHGRHAAPLGSTPRIVYAIVAGWLATSAAVADAARVDVDPQHADAEARPAMRCKMVMGWPQCFSRHCPSTG